MPTPSESLGQRIAARLVAEGVLTVEQAEHVLPKLIDGSVKPEDWRFAVEFSDQNEGSDDE